MHYAHLRESKGRHHVIASYVSVGGTPTYDIVATFTTHTEGSWWQAELNAQKRARELNGG